MCALQSVPRLGADHAELQGQVTRVLVEVLLPDLRGAESSCDEPLDGLPAMQRFFIPLQGLIDFD